MQSLRIQDDLHNLPLTPATSRKSSAQRQSHSRHIRVNKSRLPDDFFNSHPTVQLITKKLDTIRQEMTFFVDKNMPIRKPISMRDIELPKFSSRSNSRRDDCRFNEEEPSITIIKPSSQRRRKLSSQMKQSLVLPQI